MSAVVLLPLCFPGPLLPAAVQLRLTVLDTGDAAAVLVTTRHHALLYGTGSAPRGDGTSVDRHLLPALRSLRVARLDGLVLPRATAAEVTGFARLQAALPLRQAWAGDEWRAAPAPVGRCPPRLAWRWDGVAFELRAAPLPASAGAFATGACVLQVGAGERRALLAAELRAEDVAALLRVAAIGSVDLLVGPARPQTARLQQTWAAALRPQAVLATRRRMDATTAARVARAYGLRDTQLLTPAAAGPLQVELLRGGEWRVGPAIDATWVPRWRVARVWPAAAVLAAPVRYDPALTSSGER